MIPKVIDHIEEQDLNNLVNNAVLEQKTIEYKQSLTINTDREKKEFLSDVCSFANASGGDLIFGIVENRNTGAPERLEGLNIENPDAEIRRINEIIRYGIEPRIPSLDIQPVKLSDSSTALVIRILKSWVSPHRVSFNKSDSFYSRNTNGKYRMDIGELRTAFTLSNSITEQIKKFREDRISDIYANETFVPLNENAKIILHLIPLSSISSGKTYDMSKLPVLSLFNSSFGEHRYNLDGYLAYSTSNVGISSYVQLFRNGIFEAVESSWLKRSYLDIPSILFEEGIMNAFERYVSYLKDLSVGMPIFAFLTLVGTKGYVMGLDQSCRDRGNIIEKDILLIPEIVIENFDFEVEKILKPWFDAVWNACGFSCSKNFDESGKWIGRT